MAEKILITGGTGFLGNYIRQEISGSHSLGRAAKNDVIADLKTAVPILPETYRAVVHCAGKAHSIPETEEEKREFFDVNETGTENLLKSLESNVPESLVLISTVAVYGKEEGIEINEEETLAGLSPYALSKVRSEELCEDWCLRHEVRYLILRLPLVYGEDPPGNLGTMLSAMRKGRYFRIGKAENKKSIIPASDVAALIKTWIEESSLPSGVFNLSSSRQPTVREIETQLALDNSLNEPRTLPEFIVRILAKLGDWFTFLPINTSSYKKLTSELTFSNSKLVNELNWKGSSIFK